MKPNKKVEEKTIFNKHLKCRQRSHKTLNTDKPSTGTTQKSKPQKIKETLV